MPGYLIDDESMGRLARMLIDYEAGQLMPNGGIPGGDQDNGLSGPIVHPVRVTSLTADANGNYSGKLLQYDASSNTYYDHADIKIRDVNAEIPEVKRYLGRLAGLTSGDEVLYLIQVAVAVVESGSGSGSGSESGSESGSVIESGSMIESGSVISGSVIESGSVSGCPSGALTIEVVTNVECVDGELIITKTTLCIPGGSEL
jgi:hypothetical protein